MNAGKILFATTAIALSPCLSALADDASTPPNYIGDRISFPYDVSATRDKSAQGGTNDPVCVPAGTTLKGAGNTSDTTPQVKVRVYSDVDPKKKCDSNVAIPILKAGDILLVKPDDMKSANIYGLVSGALVVPFKYHLSGLKDFTASATIGPYIGYQFDKNSDLGVSLALIGFAGATTVSVPQTTSGQTSTQNVAGFSFGAGAIATVKASVQLGFVIGSDNVSSSANYRDNGKPWIALEIGYNFLQ